MKIRSDILLVGQTPPPYHGQAVVTSMLFDHDWGDLKVERLRMAYSDSIDAVGRASFGKIIHLFSLILQTWIMVFTKRPKILYYLPASANKAPVIRDVIYLTAVRWGFSKTVFHYHAGGLPEYLESAGVLGRIAKRLYAKADVSIEICKTKHSPGEMFKARQTVYVPNGLDVELKSRGRAIDGRLRVMFLGALNEGKGVMDAIRAAKILKNRGLEVEFQMVGAWASEKFKVEAMALVAAEDLGEVVYFSGVLKGDDKWQAYADAGVFFFPSHYQSENFPLVLIEAMAFGLPVVSTNWRGIPQLVGESDAAILCDINAPEEYADALEELAKNTEKRKQMGQAAKAHYEARYTRERFISSMEKVFRDALTS